MSEFKDWQVTLPFSVPTGDLEGEYTEELLDAAIEQAPSCATGFVAGANTDTGEVWITLVLESCSKDLARSMSIEMHERVLAEVPCATTQLQIAVV